MLSGVYLQLIENVSVDVLHVLPVDDGPMLNRVAQLDHALVFVSFLTNELLLVEGSEHDFLVLGAANASVEVQLGSLISRMTSFHLS